jgi:hypothetical protein
MTVVARAWGKFLSGVNDFLDQAEASIRGFQVIFCPLYRLSHPEEIWTT